MSPAIEPLRLRDALPDLADELKRLLSNEGEDDIADQIDAPPDRVTLQLW